MAIRKTLSIVLTAIALALSFVTCNDEDKDKDNKPQPSPDTTVVVKNKIDIDKLCAFWVEDANNSVGVNFAQDGANSGSFVTLSISDKAVKCGYERRFTISEDSVTIIGDDFWEMMNPDEPSTLHYKAEINDNKLILTDDNGTVKKYSLLNIDGKEILFID